MLAFKPIAATLSALHSSSLTNSVQHFLIARLSHHEEFRANLSGGTPEAGLSERNCTHEQWRPDDERIKTM
jgi:hypothetical protein